MPDAWVEQTIEGCAKYHKILATNTIPPTHTISHTVTGEGDALHIEVLGRHLSKDTPALSILNGLPKNTPIKRKVELIDRLKVCDGNCDPSMLALAGRGGKFYNIRGVLVAEVEQKTIRHVKCEVLIKKGKRCCACERHRISLRVKRSRKRKIMRGKPPNNVY